MDLSLVNRIGSLAARSAPKWLVDPLSRLAVKRMLAQKKEYRCQLTTVSDIIQTQVKASSFVDVVCCMQTGRLGSLMTSIAVQQLLSGIL